MLSNLGSKLDEIKVIEEKLEANRCDTKDISKNLKRQLIDIFNVIFTISNSANFISMNIGNKS